MRTLRINCFRLISRSWPERLTERREERDGFVDIIMTHGVHDSSILHHGHPPLSSVSLDSFRTNLESLVKVREVIGLSEAVEILEMGNRPKRRYGVLTFDDSLACTSRVAIPEVLRVGLPATVFVSTEILDTREPYWWLRLDHAWLHAKTEQASFSGPEGETVVIRKNDPASMCRAKCLFRAMHTSRQYSEVARVEEAFGVFLSDPATRYPYAEAMTWTDVRELANKGIEIGSHTVSHANLAMLDISEAARELHDSKKRIESELDMPCHSFCYPYGIYTPEVSDLVRKAGYKCATSTISPGRNLAGQCPFQLHRFSITSEPYKLGFELSGLPRWLRI